MSNQPAVLMNWNPPVSWRPPFNVTAASAYSSRPPSSQTVQLRSTPASRPPYAFPIATFRSSGYREGGAALPTPVRTEPAANPTTTSANAARPDQEAPSSDSRGWELHVDHLRSRAWDDYPSRRRSR